MTSKNKYFSKHFSHGGIAIAAAFVLFAAGASAQTPAPAPAPQAGGAMGQGGHDMKGMGGMGMMDHGAGGGMSHGGGMMHEMLCGVTEHVEGGLAYLKTELKLTDQQQGAWNGFADAYRAATQKTAKMCAASEAAGADHSAHQGVVGHLAMMERHMSDHLESIRALKAAIDPLYAALTDEQKKTADHVITHVMGVGMEKMMGGMGGGMGHGDGGAGGMSHGMGGMDHGAGGGMGGMGGMDHGAGGGMGH